VRCCWCATSSGMRSGQERVLLFPAATSGTYRGPAGPCSRVPALCAVPPGRRRRRSGRASVRRAQAPPDVRAPPRHAPAAAQRRRARRGPRRVGQAPRTCGRRQGCAFAHTRGCQDATSQRREGVDIDRVDPGATPPRSRRGRMRPAGGEHAHVRPVRALGGGNVRRSPCARARRMPGPVGRRGCSCPIRARPRRR
jgi:hypothetical protein